MENSVNEPLEKLNSLMNNLLSALWNRPEINLKQGLERVESYSIFFAVNLQGSHFIKFLKLQIAAPFVVEYMFGILFLLR